MYSGQSPDHGKNQPVIRVLHELLTAANFITLYDDMDRMREFLHEALHAIPGMGRVLLCIDGCGAGEEDFSSGPFRACLDCPNLGDGRFRIVQTTCLHETDSSIYVIPMRTNRSEYGFVCWAMQQEGQFQFFKPAVHNFTNTIAMQIENIRHRKNLELEVKERTAELEAANRNLKERAEEKELLLREIHHRVKNNLNIVISLLRMQLGTFQDRQVQEALQLSIDRVSSISLVHRFLYQSRTLASINLSEYLGEFIREISGTYLTDSRITIRTDIEEVSVPIDAAVPVSLIINEIVTNALKYAFPGGAEGEVAITVAALDDGGRKTEQMLLTVTDNGIGLPRDFDIRQASSLGMQLIQGLTEQLGGELILTSPASPSFRGTSFYITVPVSQD